MTCLNERRLFRSGSGIAFFLGAMLLFGNASAQIELPARQSLWSFSVGYKRRYNIDINVQGGTPYSAAQLISEFGAASALSAGPGNATADRLYDNGYVYRDIGTDVAGPRQGLTWNYEYVNSSQYNAGADTLTFTKTSFDPVTREIEDQASGIQCRLNRLLVEKKRLSLSALFDFSYCDGEDHSWSDQSTTVIDTYHLQGVDPSARHNPALNGDLYEAPVSLTDPRPVIDNIPDRREWDNLVTFSMEYDIATLGAGFEMEWAVHDRISLQVSPRVEHYRMNIETSRTETDSDASGVVLSHQWHDAGTHQESFWGVVLECGVQAKLTEKWFMRVHGDSIQTWDDIQIQTGPILLEMDMSGWSCGIDLGIRL